MDGRIHVWDSEADVELVLSQKMHFSPTCLAWNPVNTEEIYVVADRGPDVTNDIVMACHSVVSFTVSHLVIRYGIVAAVL